MNLKWTTWIGIGVTVFMFMAFFVDTDGWYVAPLLGLLVWAGLVAINWFWDWWDASGSPRRWSETLAISADQARMRNGDRPLGQPPRSSGVQSRRLGRHRQRLMRGSSDGFGRCGEPRRPRSRQHGGWASCRPTALRPVSGHAARLAAATRVVAVYSLHRTWPAPVVSS